MKFYDVMQLDASKTKNLLKETENKNDKRRYRFAFVVKNVLCMLFCITVVMAFSFIFGSENSTAGVIVLLAILSMRQANLDIKPVQGTALIPILFGILAIAPHLAAGLSTFPAAICNLCSILLIVVLSCHNMYMFNHTTFVLGYILLTGYDVSGDAFIRRIFALMAGSILVSLIYYKNHRKDASVYSIGDLFRGLLVFDERTQWQLKMTVGITSGMLMGSFLGIPRVMWIGFSCMTLLSPLQNQVTVRLRQRIVGVVAGSLLFGFLYHFLPGDPLVYIGLLGGFCVGFSGTYRWQTVFNCFGSLAVAVGTMGLQGAVLFRIINNVAGVLYSFCFHKCWEGAGTLLLKEKPCELEEC